MEENFALLIKGGFSQSSISSSASSSSSSEEEETKIQQKKRVRKIQVKSEIVVKAENGKVFNTAMHQMNPKNLLYYSSSASQEHLNL